MDRSDEHARDALDEPGAPRAAAGAFERDVHPTRGRIVPIDDGVWAAARTRLYRIALAFGLPADDVPGVVQETFLAAHRARVRFDPGRGSFDGWLASILVRRARNRLRALRRRRKLAATWRAFGLAAPQDADPRVARLEAHLVVDRLLAVLTDSQREVVSLYEIGEMPAEDVARLLGITAAGVRSIARDARNRLAAAARASRRPKETEA